MIESLTEKLASIYSVRLWDEFWHDWAMIPITGLGRDEAINMAIDVAMVHDCGESGTQEAQVWIECLGGTAYQMVGYVEYSYDDDGVGDYHFIESFS